MKKSASSKIQPGQGAQFIDPNAALNQNDVDDILKRAGLKRSDLLKLLYDDEVFACTERRTAAVLATPWLLEGSAPPWLYDELAALHENAARVIMQAKWLGASLGEMLYQEEKDGRLRIQAIVPRPLEQFQQRAGQWFWQPPQGEALPVPPEKILFSGVNVHPGNPYGDALLSRIYWAWFNKNYGEQFWSKFAERHASPLTVIKGAINSVNQAEAAQELGELAAAVAQAVSAGTVAISEQDALEFVEANNDGEAHAKFLRHHIQRIQKTLLGRVITADLANGSRAAQETDDHFYRHLSSADLAFCEKGMNHLIFCLLSANGQPTDGVYFSYQRPNAIDRERWERDVALLNTGRLRFTAQYFQEQHGFEAHYLEMLDDAAPESASRAQLSASLLPPGAQEMEANIQRSLARQPEDLSAAMLADFIQDAENEADFIARLHDFYAEQEAEHYQRWLAQALAMAEAQGFYHASKGRF